MRFDQWEEALCHHGIKGQKHGVRRFQYEDGSLTELGRERYYGLTSNNPRLVSTAPSASAQKVAPKSNTLSAAGSKDLSSKIENTKDSATPEKSKETTPATATKPAATQTKTTSSSSSSSGKGKGRKKKKKTTDKEKTTKKKAAAKEKKAQILRDHGSSNIGSHHVQSISSSGHNWATSASVRETTMRKPIIQVFDSRSKL